MDSVSPQLRNWGDSRAVCLSIVPTASDKDEYKQPEVGLQTGVTSYINVSVGPRKAKTVHLQVRESEPVLSMNRVQGLSIENLDTKDQELIRSSLDRAYQLLLSTAEERALITKYIVRQRYNKDLKLSSSHFNLESQADADKVDPFPVFCYYCYGKLVLFSDKLGLLPSFWATTPPNTGKVLPLKMSAVLPFTACNYVTAVAPYPSLFSMIAVGTVKGSVAVLNLDFSTRTVDVLHAQNSGIMHSGKIIFMQWFNAGKLTGLITADTDGKIFVWELQKSDSSEGGDDGKTLRLCSGIACVTKLKNVTTGSNLNRVQLYKIIASVQPIHINNTAGSQYSLGFVVAFTNGSVQEVSFYLKPTAPPKYYEHLLNAQTSGMKIIRQYGLAPGVRIVRPLPQALLKVITNKVHYIHFAACRLILQRNGLLYMAEVQTTSISQRCSFEATNPITDFILVGKTIVAIDSSGGIAVFDLCAGEIVTTPVIYMPYTAQTAEWTITLCSYQAAMSATILAQCGREARIVEVPLIDSVLTDELQMAKLYVRLFV